MYSQRPLNATQPDGDGSKPLRKSTQGLRRRDSVILGHGLVAFANLIPKLRVKNIRTICGLFLVAGFCAPALAEQESAQQELLQQRWQSLETTHFRILSQLSPRRTAAVAADLESWRQAVGRLLTEGGELPKAAVPNLVYLFDNHGDFAHFTLQDNAGFQLPTPRANYLAMSLGEDMGRQQGLHHYAHFLIRNFIDLRMPRWYEEGLAAYYSRGEVDGGSLRLPAHPPAANARMAELSAELAMERLLYEDAALASPRLIQIANLKSEALLVYLRHGHEEGFADHREALAKYFQHLLAGRNPRFAFDQSFDMRPEQLDAELGEYLRTSRAREWSLPVAKADGRSDFEPVAADPDRLALQLGELALNAGRFEVAERFFRGLTGRDTAIARAWSGLGDSLRFQDTAGDAGAGVETGARESDRQIAAYYNHALALEPDNPDILLDFGEYWEYELEDCDNEWAPARFAERLAAARQAFERVIAVHPDNPEANLAIGEIHLFPGQDWRDGADHARRAFELLPADTFIMEQAVKYAIEAEEFDRAEQLIAELAQPLHYWGEPDWVSDLRLRLLAKRRGEVYDQCASE